MAEHDATGALGPIAETIGRGKRIFGAASDDARKSSSRHRGPRDWETFAMRGKPHHLKPARS